MADLSDIQAAEFIKIIGSDSTGAEQTPVESTSAGGLHTNLRDAAGIQIDPRQIKGANIASAFGQVTPYGYVKTSGEFINLFGDNFDSSGFDTLNRWNAPVLFNGGATTQSLGTLTLSTTTTTLSQIAISTQPTFTTSVSFLWFGMITQMESPLVIGPHRFWGFGTPNPTYAVATPLLNAIGFEIDAAGDMNAVIYSNGTKIFSTLLTYDPTNPGGYAVATKANVTYFFINDLEVPVATSYLNTPDSYTLPYRQHIINPVSATSAATNWKTQALGLADSAPNQIGISDGAFPWRKLKVNPDGSINTTSNSTLQINNGQVFSTVAQVVAATSGQDNPLLFLRNPLSSGKTILLKKVLLNVETPNINVTYKIFAQPVLNTTISTITNITQPALSSAITVTTATPHGATTGAELTISGTTNFNGTYSVISVTSTTIYALTGTIHLTTITNTSGTSTVTSSVGTNKVINPLKRVTSPMPSIALATTLPTVTSNGTPLVIAGSGQNNPPLNVIDDDLISLAAGQNILITADPDSNNRSIAITIIWAEV